MVKCSCLCTQVRFEDSIKPKNFGVCHCSDCRKWTGGVFMSVSGGDNNIFDNEKYIGRYSHSDWAERGFCTNCGTNLFFRMKKSNHYFLMLGVIDDDISLHFEEQQFIDKKPSHYSFSNDTKLITKARMMEMLDNYLSQFDDSR